MISEGLAFGGDAARATQGTIHWVSAPHSHAAEVRLYDRLFAHEQPELEPDQPSPLNAGSVVR